MSYNSVMNEIEVLRGRVAQSYRCYELIQANASSPEDQERYGEIVLLDIDDLAAEIEDLKSELEKVQHLE